MISWPEAVAVSALLLVCRFSYGLFVSRRALSHVPGPNSPSLVWGEEWKLYHTKPGSHYHGWKRTFGKVVKISGAFGHPMLCITDESAISYILGAEGIYNFPKPHGVRIWFQKTLGKGILYVEGKESHERQRRLLAPAFSQPSVRNFMPVFHEISSKLAVQWLHMMDDLGRDEIEIEVTNWAGRFALESVGRAAFSHEFDLLSGDPSPLLEALDGLTNTQHNATSFYMRALFWIFPSILNIGKKGEMVRRTKMELGQVARKMWRDAKLANDSYEKTLMAQMLKADAASEQRMDLDEIVAQMRTILSAAVCNIYLEELVQVILNNHQYEPVSSTVAWVLYELAINPRTQEELRVEISSHNTDPTLDELSTRFPILHGVLLETLRLHPPILENHHEAAVTTSVPLSQPIPGTSESRLVIPKGTILFIPVNVMQTDSELWGDDAHIFRPRRWMDGQSQHHPSLLAFSEGPRSCIGARFAQAEIKALIVALIRQFSVRCDHEIEPFQSFVIRPRVKGTAMSSLPLKVKRV